MIKFYADENDGHFIKHIAIPTTLSGAEYTAGVGYTDEEGHKQTFQSPKLIPAVIILDANFTISTPEKLWLSSKRLFMKKLNLYY